MSGIRVNEETACNGAGGEEPFFQTDVTQPADHRFRYQVLVDEINDLSRILVDLAVLRRNLMGEKDPQPEVDEDYSPGSFVGVLNSAPERLRLVRDEARGLIHEIDVLLLS